MDGVSPCTAADAEAINAGCVPIHASMRGLSHRLSRPAERYKQPKIKLPTPSRLERGWASTWHCKWWTGQFFTTLAQALALGDAGPA